MANNKILIQLLNKAGNGMKLSAKDKTALVQFALVAYVSVASKLNKEDLADLDSLEWDGTKWDRPAKPVDNSILVEYKEKENVNE